jgi:hypothetical protein
MRACACRTFKLKIVPQASYRLFKALLCPRLFPGTVHYSDGETISHPLVPAAITESGSLERLVDFAWDHVEQMPGGASLISVDQAVARFSELLSWAWCDPETSRYKLDALRCLLDPVEGPRNLAEIARSADSSRATVSKWVVELRDRFKIRMNFHGSAVRERCRQAQNNLVTAGRHASTKTKKRVQFHEGEVGMNQYQTIRARLKTLDQAVNEVCRLESELAARPAQNTVKPATAPAPQPLQASDLSDAELREALRLANTAGNSSVVRICYNEVNRRRNA